VGQTASPGGAFVSLAALGNTTCGIKRDGQVDCWGNVTTSGAEPVPSTLHAISIDLGVSDQCVVDEAGDVTCWGAGLLGEQPPGPFQQVGVGLRFACGLRGDESIVCWVDPTQNSEPAVTNPPAGNFVQLVVGINHSCALASDGTATCWGLGGEGQVNDGTNGAWGQAIAPAGVKFARLAVGQLTSCGILESGDVQCWGAGKTAGDCDTEDTCGQAVGQTGPFVDLAIGYTHACGLLENGKITCWGSDTGGRSTPPPEFQ
jgi:alpha-tubulin suppressor-like RCC1 family protein